LPQGVWLEDLHIERIEQGWGTAGARKSVSGQPLTLRGKVYPHGVGSHTPAEIRIPVAGGALRFVATVGIDDEVGSRGSARILVQVDGKQVARTAMLTGGGALAELDVDLKGAKELVLTLSDEGDNDSDHLDLANAQLVMARTDGAGIQIAAPAATAEARIELPRTDAADGRPQINGARVAAGTPGRPFQFLVPATGERPLAFSAEGLPGGLALDGSTGIIRGSLQKPGVTVATLHVKNGKGEATRQLVIDAGVHKLAPTPPLGWNSWNCWGLSVDDAKVRAAADGFIKSGLAAHGFTYVNIDDGWEIAIPRPPRGRGRGAAAQSAPATLPMPVTRAADGTILVNGKFPDMKGLGEYIHSKGLKFGIYSSPGPTTCGGYTASWQHEEQDARTWASWGVDYIKYDWCSYSNVAPRAPQGSVPRVNSGFTIETLKKPYQLLRTVLDSQDRDMVMSLCQYGWGNVWEWGAEDGINGNVWRATGDITDNWQSMSRIGFAQNGHEAFTGPGHWNDTDMLVVGKVGWGPRLHDSRLTQNEQMTHISLWSILAAPMLLGCDLTQLDDFTTALMSNDEVLAVDQDPLGKQGKRISEEGMQQVWARPLWDGTVAVGLFNLGNEPAKVSVSLKELNAGLGVTLAGAAPVRDLWRLKDLEAVGDGVSAEVPRHGAVLLKIGKPEGEAESIARIVRLHSGK
jgi:alpha-galactosidase